ncbi:MAG: toxin-antitoxin system YwqK family antitoxin [Bacteroidota bacterium]
MWKTVFLAVLCVVVSFETFSQGATRTTHHDKEKKHIKEVYQVKDTIRNILHGRYISYYLNGNIESKGQFTNNETTGVWEFFYETGNLKMRGILRQNANYGLWEYFYESGQKSMEGNINGKNREGEWKTFYENGQVKDVGDYKNNKRTGLWRSYFEDGVLKGEVDYVDDFGTYTEYYHSGKVFAEGPRNGTKSVGHWRFFDEEGSIQAEGSFLNGKKDGEWLNYYPSGKLSSKGKYKDDEQTGLWEYYFEDGKLSSSGTYEASKKSGFWKTMNSDGSLKTEVTYSNEDGEYREYHQNGKLKVKGKTLNGKKQGKWEYFYNDGRKEGECEFNNNKGTYYGYFPNGNLQTKGTLEGDLKTGTWEIYQNDGKLSGYYRPFYDDKKLGQEIVDLAGKSNIKKNTSHGKRLTHFDARFNEFRGVIVGGNPIMVFAGRVPLGIEFYLQERLGHEFEFIGIRDPFFKSDLSIPAGKKFERGYAICIKQKLYNQVKAGMWYFGHEIRFTNFGHFINQPITPSSTDLFTFSAVEQRIEWGLLLGYRIMKRNNAPGFTIDAFISGDVGYRNFDVEPNFKSFFEDINQSKLSTSFHFGLNFGNVFSFK